MIYKPDLQQRSGERATTTSTSTSDLPPTHQQHLRLKAPRGGHIRLKPVSRAHGDQMPHITETERTGIGGARMAAKADKSTLRADKPFVRKPVRLAAKNPPGEQKICYFTIKQNCHFFKRT